MTMDKSKWEAWAERTYGSVEAGKEEMRRRRKLAENHGKGGFKYLKDNDPDKLQEITKKAAEARWGKKDVLPKE